MFRFVKDIMPEWDSKLDMLSLGIAGALGGAYWVPGTRGVGCVVQAADGYCMVPDECPVRCAIFHDALDYPEKKTALFRIGLGDVPGCTCNLTSYPLRASDMHRMPPSAVFDAVVGGRIRESMEDTLERAGLKGKKVAVATRGSAELAGAVAALLRDSNDVTVISEPSLPGVAALYRTCPTVVHLGDCSRGYLHSLAMYHTGEPGRRLVERVQSGGFRVATMDELIQICTR